jgi:hypothetical protein
MYRILRTIPKNDDDVAMANMIAQIEDEERRTPSSSTAATARASSRSAARSAATG